MRRRVLAVAGTLSFAGVAAAIAIGWSLSQPTPSRVGEPPASLGATTITFSSDSGSLIHGWVAAGRSPGGVVLLLPGVRENRRGMLDPATLLADAGFSVVLIDHQATGESPGEQITFGWLERLDVVAAIQEIKRRMPGEPIGVLGRSLGGAATIFAARDIEIAGAVLEAVYPSIEAAVDNRLRIRLGEPGTWLSPALLWQLRPRLGISASDLRPVAQIGELRCPVFIIAGTDDLHTTRADTQRLFDAAPEPKDLWLIAGADHNNYRHVAGEQYGKRIVAFFERTLRGRRDQ